MQPTLSQNYDTARIQIRLPSGSAIAETFQASDTLDKVYVFVAQHHSGPVKLAQTFPRKFLEDRSKTLKDLGLTPSAALIAQ